jgi:multidrug efflux system membrane fusion protein
MPNNDLSHSQPRSRRWAWVALICVVVAAGGAWYYFFYQADSQPAADAAKGDGSKGGARKGAKGGPGGQGRPAPVVAVAAKSADVNVYLNGLGSVSPVNTVTVRSRVDGQLMRVLFREGQMVKAGDLLAEIDPRPFEVQLNQAEGQLAKDEALLKNAQADLERYRTLFEQDSVARQQLDTQGSLVRQYEAVLKVDRAAIDSARLQLTYSRITAPLTGRLGLRQVDPGNVVHASDATGMVVITQLQPIGAVFTIPEDNLPLVMKKVRAGERLPIDAYDRAGKIKITSGTLLTVDNQIDPASGTVKLKAQFANADNALFPNQFVNVRMLVDVKRAATVVPTAAVQRGTPGTFVYTVAADRSVSIRKVVLGPVDGDNVAVEGVSPGDLVVVDGADRLREGAIVELAGERSPGGRGGAGKGGKGRGEGGKSGEGAKGGETRGKGAEGSTTAP